MPTVKLDLLNQTVVIDILNLFKDLINDERLPIDLKYEYGKKLEGFSL